MTTPRSSAPHDDRSTTDRPRSPDGDSVVRLRGEIADDLAVEGWTVKPRPSGSGVGETVAFQKGATTMGASVFVDRGYASVGGSGGCVK